jgi:very-short-patch-repair endonuclease
MPNKIIPYNKSLKHLARKLRKESTLSEVLLWKQIKGKAIGYEFHRQVPVDNFIVDFFCHELCLAIEIDGSSHDNELAIANDITRQQRLEGMGLRFIRFTDKDVKTNISGVVRALEIAIEEIHLHIQTSPLTPFAYAAEAIRKGGIAIWRIYPNKYSPLRVRLAGSEGG